MCGFGGQEGSTMEPLQWKPHGQEWTSSGWSNQPQDDMWHDVLLKWNAALETSACCAFVPF